MALTEVVRARGHEHVTGTHESTLEVTTDDWLTPAGDCILAIAADAAPADFDDAFISACQDATATITATIRAAGHEHSVVGRGDPTLTFESERSAVCRTSTHVDDRTVLLEASGAAADVNRHLVEALGDGAAATLTLRVE